MAWVKIPKENHPVELVKTSAPSCPHFDGTTVEPRTDRCEGCGSTFNLRVCTSCGHVGCCESQQGHNTRHANESGHPVIKSLPVREGHFTWCYRCRRYI